ncbi:hypothetical protein AZE42_12330 [Rhizopogon vesiculosus]|uniref:sphingolipid C(9)-methyltransferase n=1 Tax=Rhizopogon vesiculosus TaxID=180088 RepID=A0A1J8R406_9AGAM|nr:hypothetical protein AZE42_12330 [Rhizopogon vesiculosus]
MMVDKSKEVVYVLKVDSNFSKSGMARSAIVVSGNISSFSPELEHAHKIAVAIAGDGSLMNSVLSTFKKPPSPLTSLPKTDLFLDEVCTWLAFQHNITINPSILSRNLTQTGLTQKVLASERDEARREDFKASLRNDFVGDGSEFVILDETSKNERTYVRHYGRASSGQRARLTDVFVRGDRYSLSSMILLPKILSGVSLLFIFNDLYLVIFPWYVFSRGDCFYEWYVSFANQIPSILTYTSGVILDADKDVSLEELQDNKLRLVCSKLNLKPKDRLLDVSCG